MIISLCPIHHSSNAVMAPCEQPMWEEIKETCEIKLTWGKHLTKMPTARTCKNRKQIEPVKWRACTTWDFTIWPIGLWPHWRPLLLYSHSVTFIFRLWLFNCWLFILLAWRCNFYTLYAIFWNKSEKKTKTMSLRRLCPGAPFLNESHESPFAIDWSQTVVQTR